VIRYLRGRPQPRFERIPGRRAETLDCLVMALAAREGCAIAFDARFLTRRAREAAPIVVYRRKPVFGAFAKSIPRTWVRFSPQIMRGIMRAVGAITRSPNMDRRF
jgi:hypothetical protein